MDEENQPLLPMTSRKKKTDRRLQIEEFVKMFRPVLSPEQMSKELSSKLNSVVSRSYISRVMTDIDNQDVTILANKSSLDLAMEARRTYQRLEEEGFQMHARALQIRDPVERSKVEARALTQVRNAREAQDRMYKYMGITAETFRLEHVDITQTESWKSFMKTVLIYMRHVMKCSSCGHQGFDVKDLLTFMDNVRENPMYIEQYFSKMQRYRQAERDGYDGTIIDAELEELTSDEQRELEETDVEPGPDESPGPAPVPTGEPDDQELQDDDGEGQG